MGGGSQDMWVMGNGKQERTKERNEGTDGDGK